MKRILMSDRGITLVVAIMIMMLVLSITAASLFITGINARTASNVKTGTSAIEAADVGIRHALAIIPAAINFNALLTGSVTGFSCGSPCNGTSNKPTLTGTVGSYSYSVVATNNTSVAGETATSDSDKIAILTSTATGPDGSTRKIQAYIQTSGAGWTTPSTLYVPGSSGIKIGVSDPAFMISGNDTNTDGTAGSGAAVPGIGNDDASMTADIKNNQISSSYYPDILGQGYSAGPPVTPSILTLGTLDVTTLAQNIVNQGIEGTTLQTLAPGTYNSGTWGTAASPMITHITGKSALGGTLGGYGVLIIDDEVKITGSFSFNGLMIFTTKAGIKDDNSAGNAMLYGAMLYKNTAKTGINFGKGGNMYYSSQALSIVTKKWPAAFPGTPKLIAWNELMQ